MGARRDDITKEQRAQIAIEVLSPQRPWGRVTCLAEEYETTRQTVYEIAEAGKKALIEGLEPGPHGPQFREKTIRVDRNRLARGSVVLTGKGVSQRDIGDCLEELLDTRVSPAWVNGELAKREEAAAQVNSQWQVAIEETLSGDEIYSNGQPNLLLVGNDSLYIYGLTRQASCDGETWGCVLLDGPECPQFASDAGKGLAAGATLAEVAVHQLDWDHLLRPLWGQAKRLEQTAYTVLEEVEDRAVKFDQTHTSKRLAQHLAKWEQLNAVAQEKMERYDAFYSIARQVDDEFALIDLETGDLRQADASIEHLRHLGEQLGAWKGRIYKNLSNHLINWAEALFSYQPVLAQRLTPLIELWGQPAIRASSRIWQIEADEKRRPLPRVTRQARQRLWEQCLDQAVSILGEEQLWQAWDALCAVLSRSWRGSMLAECINSLLRPILDARKHTDQGCLELFRFFHNVHIFKRGKRAGYSPAQLVGLEVPDDPLLLLGLQPKSSVPSNPSEPHELSSDAIFVSTCTHPVLAMPTPISISQLVSSMASLALPLLSWSVPC